MIIIFVIDEDVCVTYHTLVPFAHPHRTLNPLFVQLTSRLDSTVNYFLYHNSNHSFQILYDSLPKQMSFDVVEMGFT